MSSSSFSSSLIGSATSTTGVFDSSTGGSTSSTSADGATGESELDPKSSPKPCSCCVETEGVVGIPNGSVSSALSSFGELLKTLLSAPVAAATAPTPTAATAATGARIVAESGVVGAGDEGAEGLRPLGEVTTAAREDILSKGFVDRVEPEGETIGGERGRGNVAAVAWGTTPVGKSNGESSSASSSGADCATTISFLSDSSSASFPASIFFSIATRPFPLLPSFFNTSNTSLSFTSSSRQAVSRFCISRTSSLSRKKFPSSSVRSTRNDERSDSAVMSS